MVVKFMDMVLVFAAGDNEEYMVFTCDINYMVIPFMILQIRCL